MKNAGILKLERTLLLVIDIQEKLMPSIHNKEEVFANTNRLIQGLRLMHIPIVVTEQYPKGLGKTCDEIEVPSTAYTSEKISFSCMLSDEIKNLITKWNLRSLILCGAEAHICVLKTALDAMCEGYEVHVVADAVSSRTPENKMYALERMRQSGAFIATTEMILFQLLDEAGSDTFKAISKLIR